MIKRREAREQALSLVFEKSFQNLPVEDLVSGAVDSRDLLIDEYALKIIKAVQEHQYEIDDVITKYSNKWKIDRLSKVSLAILRLAIAEISFVGEVDEAVIINEAVEIAKVYGGDEDPSYINGVLGGYVRSIKDEQVNTEE